MIPGEVGGSETYLRQTLRALAAHVPDVSLVLFTNRENEPVLRSDLSDFPQVEFVPLRFRAMNRYARIVREQTDLPWKATRSRVDLLWSPGYTAPLLAPCPQVLSILDMQYRRFPEDLTPLARGVTHVLVAAGARLARRVMTISEFSKQEILRFTRASADRITVTPLAADPSFGRRGSAETAAAARARLLGFTAPYALCVAHTYPHKNVHTLVDAFGRIADMHPHHLVLIGKPRLGETAFQEALSALPDASRVHRLPGVVREELIALYQGADVFVFPSLYEGFGLPVVEAMLAGAPVVTTRSGSIPEVAGPYAVYADGASSSDLAEKMRHVLGWSAGERSQRQSAARAWAERFSWQRTAEGTAACFRQAVET
jgi:glycosyltransferase involved in cell wall biosynthesis